jgi:hypothetical protein
MMGINRASGGDGEWRMANDEGKGKTGLID